MELGKELNACPYYGTRLAAREAQVGTNGAYSRMVIYNDYGNFGGSIDDNLVMMVMI